MYVNDVHTSHCKCRAVTMGKSDGNTKNLVAPNVWVRADAPNPANVNVHKHDVTTNDENGERRQNVTIYFDMRTINTKITYHYKGAIKN
jgi:hypothetical protein